MARRGNKGSEEEGGNWMDTYGDMVTLILTFFVLLYSMSSIDQQKWQYIAQAFSSSGEVINAVIDEEHDIKNPTGNLAEEAQLNAGEVPETFDQLYQYLVEYVKQNGLGESIEVEKGAASVILKFRDNIFFNPDGDLLLQEGKDVLTGISAGIKAVDQYILGIRINGYTAEANSSVNDRDLSTGRANAVLKHLEAMQLCDSSKYSASGYGKYRPIVPNDTEENRAKNRRVEIVIARNDANYNDPAVIQELLKMEYGDNFVIPSTDEAIGIATAPAVTEPVVTEPAVTEPAVTVTAAN